MDGVITALIGVSGTLVGVLLGWILNSKVGRTKIYATLIHSTEFKVTPSDNESSISKFLFRCVAINSRQVPVLLNNFHVEMKTARQTKPIILSVHEPDVSYQVINGVKIDAQLALPQQLIPPCTLHEFTFKLNYRNSDIYFKKLTLVAFNEKHRCKKFLLYDGLKMKPPKETGKSI